MYIHIYKNIYVYVYIVCVCVYVHAAHRESCLAFGSDPRFLLLAVVSCTLQSELAERLVARLVLPAALHLKMLHFQIK